MEDTDTKYTGDIERNNFHSSISDIPYYSNFLPQTSKSRCIKRNVTTTFQMLYITAISALKNY